MFPVVAPSPKGLPSHIPNHIVKEIVAVTAAGKVVCVHSTAVASTAPCPLPNAHTNLHMYCTHVYLLIRDFKLADYNFFSSKRVFLRYQSHRILAIELLGFELSGPVLVAHLLQGEEEEREGEKGGKVGGRK